MREEELPAVEGLGGRSSMVWIGPLTEGRGRSRDTKAEVPWALEEDWRLSRSQEFPDNELELETDLDMPVSQERKPWLVDDENDGAALEVLL